VLTIGELAAAVRFVGRERPGAVASILWAIARSPELVQVCREIEPAAHEYANVAGLDGIVNAVLTASDKGQELLASGLRSSPPGVRQRLQGLEEPPSSKLSSALRGLYSVLRSVKLAAAVAPECLQAVLGLVSHSPNLRNLLPDPRRDLSMLSQIAALATAAERVTATLDPTKSGVKRCE
jgi:hypothetical protein